MNPHSRRVAEAIAKKMSELKFRIADSHASHAAFEHGVALVADAAIEAYLEATGEPEPSAMFLQTTLTVEERDALLDEASLKGWP